MSWHVSFYSNSDPDALADAFGTAMQENASAFANEESRAQAMTCLEIVQRLVAEDALGDVLDIFVEISGHANDGHAIVPGMSNSFVRIQVTQQSRVPAAVADEEDNASASA